MGRVLKSNNSSNSGDGGGGNGNDGISGSSSTSSSAPKIPNTDVHEAYEMNASTWQTRMHRVAIKLAGTYIGQAMMMQFDKLLWTLEKTAAWICSGKTDGKRAKPVASLVRPLPWILFLPTLVALRYARVLFSLISICCGCDEIEPSTMVSYLHQTRRTLRHIAHDAKQQQAIDKQNQATSIDYNKRLSGIVSFLSELIGTILSDKVHTNNKTSLNASFASDNDPISSSSDDDEDDDDNDSEDQAYQDFLSRTLDMNEADTSDDEDFVLESNGDNESNTDSQSSIATNLSDDEIGPGSSNDVEKGSNCNVTDNDSNYSTNTSTATDTNTSTNQYEKANEEDTQIDSTPLQSSTDNNKDDDGSVNQTFQFITETAHHDHHQNPQQINSNSSNVQRNRGKQMNRHHKNGNRFQAKTQNNGRNVNGAHASRKSKPPKNHHVKSSSEFIADAAADRA